MNTLSPLATSEAVEFFNTFQLLSCRRVLLLENDDSVAEMIRETLLPKSFAVTSVKTGPEGLHHVIKQCEFDLILCDMATSHPPGLVFYQAVSRVRPDLCSRFIFMTGHHGNPEVDSFIRRANGVVLWKPFEAHVLLETIEFVLRKQRKNVSFPVHSFRKAF